MQPIKIIYVKNLFDNLNNGKVVVNNPKTNKFGLSKLQIVLAFSV